MATLAPLRTPIGLLKVLITVGYDYCNSRVFGEVRASQLVDYIIIVCDGEKFVGKELARPLLHGS